ncbi:metal ABC transporter ATP-binding protein [Spiribacter insolitus]|uniref:Metal ABC transporter ATP-binding protein n=1 Tax=Spiribacter insolitus TaxID=3122417 RepID=A0ABV3TA08_9GAMM
MALSSPIMANPQQPLIEAAGVNVHIGGRHILENIELSLSAGEIVTVVGPNGSGKSTLLRALIGAMPLDSGRIRRAPGLRVGYVPQRLHIDPTLPLSVRRFLNLPQRHSRHAIDQALARAGIPGRADAAMSALSGGQFQRALMARALMDEPGLLMLDEASQGLDQTGTADFYRQLEEIRDQLGCGILMVSHDLHVVMRAADRVICLNHHICCQGHPEAVTAAPEYRALFGTDDEEALAIFRHDPHKHPHEHEREDEHAG